MPVGSQVVITYDGTDITDKVLFATASFEAQLNAQPGTFEFTVSDVDQTMSFITGKEIVLTIDGTRTYGGYLTMVSRKFAFPVDDTVTEGPEGVETRQWVLRGADYNLLFDKRVLRNASNYLSQLPSFTSSRMDGDLIRNELCARFLDIPAGFNTTNLVDDVTCPYNDCSVSEPTAWMQQGTTWRKQMEDFAQFSGAVWYIDAAKFLHWHALEDVESRWGFSDVPNNKTITIVPSTWQGATYGFRELDGTEDGSLIVNDALIWGGSEWAGQGGTVFSREENAASIALHNRWQLAETHFGELGYGIQRGVDVRSNLIVNGSPGAVAGDQNRGLRFPQWNFRFAWYAHDVPTISGQKDHLNPGDLVPIILYTFGTDALHPLIQTLPLRQVRISFPNLDPDGFGYVRYDGFFGLQLSDPWSLWRYLLRAQSRISKIQTTVSAVDNVSEDAMYGSFGNFYPNESPDGSRTTFTVKFGYIGGTTTVFLNGILQRPGADYEESSPADGEITFFVAPQVTDWIWVQCRTLSG